MLSLYCPDDNIHFRRDSLYIDMYNISFSGQMTLKNKQMNPLTFAIYTVIIAIIWYIVGYHNGRKSENNAK